MDERATAALHLRVSSGQREESFSLGTQEAGYRVDAAAHGYEVAGVFRHVHSGTAL
jgi:hypothetical protein